MRLVDGAPRPMSVTGVRDWTECPRRWWLKNEARAVAPEQSPRHLTIGTAHHAALAAAYRQAQHVDRRGAARLSATMREHEDVALATLERELSRDLTFFERVEEIGNLLALLDELPIPAPAAILGVELPFKTMVGDLYLVGTMDLALRTGPSSIHIRDWKFSSTPEVDSTQAAVYIAVARVLWPWAREVTFGFYSIKKREETPTRLTGDVIDHRLSIVDWAASEMDNACSRAALPDGDPAALFPAQPDREVCGSCRFRSYCPTSALAPGEIIPGFSPEEVASTRDSLIRKLRK